jgi:TatA/E family protein of Tat protein translocase
MPLPNIGLPELIIILVIALLVIGPGKLPEVGSALGKSIREFRKAATDVQDAATLVPPASAPQAGAPAQAAPVAPAAAAPVAPAAAAPVAPVAAAPAPSPEVAAAAPAPDVAAPAPAAPAPATEPQPNVLIDAAAPNEISQPHA